MEYVALTSDDLLGTGVVHLNLFSGWGEDSVEHIWLPLKHRKHTVKTKSLCLKKKKDLCCQQTVSSCYEEVI